MASGHSLDVDDVYMENLYNRLVCVVYFRHHSTRLMDVNKALIDHGPSAISDFLNEFDPTAWSLHAYHHAVGDRRWTWRRATYRRALGPLEWTIVVPAIGRVAGVASIVVRRRRR